MDTQEFLRLVLPRGGLKVMAHASTYEQDGEQIPTVRFSHTPSIEALAEAVLATDARGITTYFAVQGYGDWYRDKHGKPKLRTQENVVAIRSLYDDLDVEEGNPRKYPDRDSAKADIQRLAKAIGVRPTVTTSGGGFHVYIPLDRDILPDQWLRLAALKRDITAFLGVRADRAVDMDYSRILRPPGTHNRKTDTPREVRVIMAGPAYSPEDIEAKMEAFIQQHDVPPSSLPGRPPVDNPFAAAVVDYPPSSAVKIIEHCSALRDIAEVKGDVEEPLWRGMLGVVKHTTEGDALCHEWSSGYAGYDANETQDKIDHWTKGPALCSHFDQHIGCGKTCSYNGKIKSPIQLGLSEVAPSVEVAPEEAPPPVTEETAPVIAGQTIPHWSEAFRWNGATLSARTKDKEGAVIWKPFMRTLAFPLRRVRVEDGTWELVIRALEKNSDWREFQIPTSDLAAPDALAKSLAKYEVFLMDTGDSRKLAAAYMSQLTENLQQLRVGATTIDRLGWTEDYKGFILGDQKFDGDASSKVMCGSRIPDDCRGDFGTNGTLEEWVSNIDILLNRPNAEIMQFALCHALGAPLVKLMGSSNWHGIPFVLIGESGQGKSTISKIACSPFGAPEKFERSARDEGATLNAVIGRVAAFNNLPFVLDELTGRDYKALVAVGYALGNGRKKERLMGDGTFASTGEEWHTNTIISSNESIYEKLATNQTQYQTDAVNLRFFEVKVPDDYVKTVFADVSQTFVEKHISAEYGQYGHAGRLFLQFVVKNNTWVREQLQRARSHFNPKSSEENKERFYRDAIVTALVAGKIAKKLGLIHFDVGAMGKWALDHVVSVRENRRAAQLDPAEMLAQYVASLHERLIVTKRINDGRAGERVIELPAQVIRGAPLGRVAIEDQKVYVTSKSITDWCREANYPRAVVKQEMDRVGLLIYDTHGSAGKVMRLGTGTPIASSPCQCYELNFNMLYGTGASIRAVPSLEPVKKAGSKG